MTREEIISQVLNEDNISQSEKSDQLENMIDKEISKSKPDCELIYELTLNALESKDKKPIYNDVNQKLKEFKSIQEKERKHFHMPKWATVLAAACMVFIFSNAISVSAWNNNIFSSIIEFNQKSVKIFFHKDEEIVLPTSEYDPYGIIGKCNEIGIFVETPHYIPDGFILTTLETHTDDVKAITFIYTNKNKLINITIDDLTEDSISIPSDHHNIFEREISGHTAVISEEDNQMNASYCSGIYTVGIFTKNLAYSECNKLLDSIRY